jgi:hypothetical protein
MDVLIFKHVSMGKWPEATINKIILNVLKSAYSI